MATTPRAMGSHQSARSITDTWLTPPQVITALGGADSFDLDPCTIDARPWPTARRHYTAADDGLAQPWRGRAFVNPPYSRPLMGLFLARLGDHGDGVALIFARTETDDFQRWVWQRAHGLLFLFGRLHFHYPDPEDPGACASGADHLWIVKDAATKAKGCRLCGRAKANSGAPSVLVAYGADELDRLAACGMEGALVPLRMPRAYIMTALELSWTRAVVDWVRARPGPVDLADLYRAFAAHPKARRNRNYRAKLRQTLQRGPFERVGRGSWRLEVV